MALELLSDARRTSKDCLYCAADLGRREAIALRDLGQYGEALAKVGRARAIYAKHGDHRHDPDGDGPSNCALAESWIYTYSGDLSNAINTARAAVPRVSPYKGEDLYVALWYALAYALFHRRESNDIARTAWLCDQHVARLGEKVSQTRVRLTWFRAKIYEAEKNLESARNKLEDALLDVRELKLPAGVSAIASDLERLVLDPESFKTRLERDVWELDLEKEKLILPDWLEPLRDILKRVIVMARTDVEAAIRTLRSEGGGDRFLPQIA